MELFEMAYSLTIQSSIQTNLDIQFLSICMYTQKDDYFEKWSVIILKALILCLWCIYAIPIPPTSLPALPMPQLG